MEIDQKFRKINLTITEKKIVLHVTALPGNPIFQRICFVDDTVQKYHYVAF